VSNLNNLERDQKGLEVEVQSLNEKVQALKLNCSKLEEEEFSHSYSISIYRELEKMGMGIKQLKLLLNIVTEIATAHNISKDKATEKFFSDVQKDYDDKLGFESELQNLKSEVQKSERMHLELNDKAAALNSIILKQSDQIQQVSGFVEFGPLVQAANGQLVPENQLKAAFIKAMEIYLISSDPNRFSTKSLQRCKALLTKEIELNPTNNFQ
ncbi:MAG: hypothetical protein WAM14_14785, partial [Candidatus Nitrosopolaris sp.]